jgi:hypothetical protein
MTEKADTTLMREGELLAEVAMTLYDLPEAWEPYLSVEDAVKLDAVRRALKEGDLKTAAELAKVYRLVAVQAG